MNSIDAKASSVGGATIRRIVQVVAHLSCPDGNAERAIHIAVKECLKWLAKSNRAGALPGKAWSKESFELDIVGKRLEVLAPNANLWIARFDHPDGAVPGRAWSTELAIAASPGTSPIFGLRLTCASHGSSAPIQPTIPGIVRQLTEGPGLEEGGYALTREPLIIDNEEDVNSLISFLENRGRRKPVFLVSEQDDGATVIDPVELAQKVVGVAYVAVLPHRLSFYLTDRIGRQLSVWGGAVRVYAPDFDAEDSRNRHPITFAKQILGNSGGAQGFVSRLAEKACYASAEGADALRRMPTFATSKSRITTVGKEIAKEISDSSQNYAEMQEYISALVEDNFALNDRIKELIADNEQYSDLYNVKDEEAKAAEQDARAQEARVQHWIRENKRLKVELGQVRGISPSLVVDPDSLQGLEHWIDENFPDKMRIIPKAAKEAARSRYQNVAQVYQALRILAEDYRDCRTGNGDIQSTNKKLLELGLELKASLVKGDYSSFGDVYRYHWGGAEKKYFDQHLKGSASRDPREGLRIYFHWLEEEEIVVIGWLTTHLRNHNTD